MCLFDSCAMPTPSKCTAGWDSRICLLAGSKTTWCKAPICMDQKIIAN